MEVNQNITQDLIDQLIISNQESHMCLRTSAQVVADLALRAILQSYAKTHETLELELTGIASKLHLSACERQTQAIMPAVPGRSSFQYAMATKDRYAILAECQVHLRQTLERYEEIMSAKLPQWVTVELGSQMEQIERAYHNIYRMCAMAQTSFTRRTTQRNPKVSIIKGVKSRLPGMHKDASESLALS